MAEVYPDTEKSDAGQAILEILATAQMKDSCAIELGDVFVDVIAGASQKPTAWESTGYDEEYDYSEYFAGTSLSETLSLEVSLMVPLEHRGLHGTPEWVVAASGLQINLVRYDTADDAGSKDPEMASVFVSLKRRGRRAALHYDDKSPLDDAHQAVIVEALKRLAPLP